MTEFDEQAALEANPFESDFGDPTDRILKDKIVTARKQTQCCTCGEQINPGNRIRSMTAIFDGDFKRYAWCPRCCAAMAAIEDDEDE